MQKQKNQQHLTTFKQFAVKNRELEARLNEIKNLPESDNFFDIGSNPDFCVKWKELKSNGVSIGKYCGEWSKQTDLPYGKGFYLESKTRQVFIGYY